mgnify:CR=1 FL=1
MGRKKSKTIILILIILLIICIILAGVAYCYFATDLLKSNKQLFFKYAGQIGNAENGLIENSLTQYLEKKENTPYTNEGKITLNITENTIINVNGYYWFATASDDSHLYSWNINAQNNASLITSSYGMRPVIKIDSLVYVDGGSGTQADPYIITKK